VPVAGFFSVLAFQRWRREREFPAATEKSTPRVTSPQSGAQDRANTPPPARILHGHQNPVAVVTLASQGQALLSADTAGEIRVWDFYADEALSRIDASDLSLRRAILTPDGREIVACGNSPTICSWKAATGEFLRNFKDHSAGVTAVRTARPSQGGVVSHVRLDR
jgi:WD40 repeat protein